MGTARLPDRSRPGPAAGSADKPKALDRDKRTLAVELYREKKIPVTKICTMTGISTPTLYGLYPCRRRLNLAFGQILATESR